MFNIVLILGVALLGSLGGIALLLRKNKKLKGRAKAYEEALGKGRAIVERAVVAERKKTAVLQSASKVQFVTDEEREAADEKLTKVVKSALQRLQDNKDRSKL